MAKVEIPKPLALALLIMLFMTLALQVYVSLHGSPLGNDASIRFPFKGDRFLGVNPPGLATEVASVQYVQWLSKRLNRLEALASSMPIQWSERKLADPFVNGSIRSTGGTWGSSYADSVPVMVDQGDLFQGIEFKFDRSDGSKSEAMLGLACGAATAHDLIYRSDSCYYMVYMHLSGQAFIKAKGTRFDYRPESLSSGIGRGFDWSNDVWQLRLDSEGRVQYLRNAQVLYTSTSKPSFPIRVHVDFSSLATVSYVKPLPASGDFSARAAFEGKPSTSKKATK